MIQETGFGKAALAASRLNLISIGSLVNLTSSLSDQLLLSSLGDKTYSYPSSSHLPKALLSLGITFRRFLRSVERTLQSWVRKSYRLAGDLLGGCSTPMSLEQKSDCVIIAPQKSKGQKMALGDFLQDSCMCRLLPETGVVRS